MTIMESFNGHLIIRLTPPQDDDPSLAQHSFYTYMQWREFSPQYPHLVLRITRIYEATKKLSDKEFVRKFDVKIPQKPGKNCFK